jgi:hypothetical protein
MSTINCPQCGATNQVSPGQTILNCSFCGTPLQVPGQQAPIGSTPGMYGQFFGPPPGPPPMMPMPVYVQPRSSGFGALWLLVAIPVLVAMLGGAIWFFARTQGGDGSVGGGGAGGGSLGGGGPLLGGAVICGGNDERVLEGYSGDFTAGAAITASGNCSVKCTRCRLKAPVGIIASGNAEVTLVDSSVDGTSQGVVASGNADVKLLGGSTLAGSVSTSGNAHVTTPPASAAGGKAHGH